MAPRSRTDRAWTIRQLCREFDVTPRALRFYEDKGLLAPERRGTSRIYSVRDRARLQLILRGKRVGFSLAEVAELLALYDREDGGAVQMAASLGKFRERIADLRRQQEDIGNAVAELEAGCAWIEDRLSQVRPDLLPQAQDYDSVFRARLDAAE